MLIEGEAGIGKTSLWEECVALAEIRSGRVLRCRPAEAETKLSYTGLGDLLGPVADEELAGLVDVQRSALEMALLRAGTERSADPRAISTGLVTLLTRLANEGPLVLAIDDVQWLDADSAQALEFAFRRLPPSLALILARRTGGHSPAPLGLERSLPAERLERFLLEPLSLAALREVLKRRLGTAFSRPTLVRLHELSGGNPLFGIEIGRELLRRGGAPGGGARLPVPETLQELVAARLEPVSPVAREILLVAAALSRPTVSVIEEALTEPAKMGAALIEAEEAGLITVEDGRVRFTHPLLASTMYTSASWERRRQLHGRLAQVAVEEEERARHLALSASGADENIASVLERAARNADQRGAQLAAAELLHRARRLTPADRHQDLARRTLGEASALFSADDLGRSRELAQEAVDIAASGPVRAEAHLLLGRISHFDRMSGVSTAHLERALAEAGDDRSLRGRIHAELAWTYGLNPARGVEHAEAAVGMLDAENEAGLTAFALFTKFFLDAQLGRGADRALLKRGLELEQKAADKTDCPAGLPAGLVQGGGRLRRRASALPSAGRVGQVAWRGCLGRRAARAARRGGTSGRGLGPSPSGTSRRAAAALSRSVQAADTFCRCSSRR